MALNLTTAQVALAQTTIRRITVTHCDQYQNCTTTSKTEEVTNDRTPSDHLNQDSNYINQVSNRIRFVGFITESQKNRLALEQNVSVVKREDYFRNKAFYLNLVEHNKAWRVLVYYALVN